MFFSLCLNRVIDYYRSFCISDLRRVRPSRHVLPWRHQTGSELVVLHGCCLAAVLSARGPKQLFLSSSSSSSSSRTMDGWARGHSPEPSPTSRRCFAFLPSSLAFPWWLNRTCASLWRQPLAHVCCCLLVYRNVFLPQNHLFSSPLSIFPLITRSLSLVFRLFLVLFGWKCRERRVTIRRRGLIGWNPAITVCTHTVASDYCQCSCFCLV